MKIAIVSGMLLFVIACSSHKDIVSNTAFSITEEDKRKGRELYQQSDCMTCHAIEDKERVGPSFMQVASRYDANATTLQTLTKKIREGGTGNWGSIYMTPHSSINETELNQVVKFILSLKK